MWAYKYVTKRGASTPISYCNTLIHAFLHIIWVEMVTAPLRLSDKIVNEPDDLADSTERSGTCMICKAIESHMQNKACK